LDNSKKEYANLQKTVLTDLLKKLIKSSIPIEFKIMANKYIKIKDMEACDSLENIIETIDENKTMYIMIYKIQLKRNM
jgi:hypothetical protein